MLNENNIVKVLFEREKYVEYEVPEEGIMFYSESEEKTYFLNCMTVSILGFCDSMSVSEIISYIQNNFDIEGIAEDELKNDVFEILNILLENKFIQL